MPTIASHAKHDQDHAHHHANSIFAKRPLLTGIAVGIGSLLPHAFLSPEASLGFAAILIALIAGIYFGFAVVNGSRGTSSSSSTSPACSR